MLPQSCKIIPCPSNGDPRKIKGNKSSGTRGIGRIYILASPNSGYGGRGIRDLSAPGLQTLIWTFTRQKNVLMDDLFFTSIKPFFPRKYPTHRYLGNKKDDKKLAFYFLTFTLHKIKVMILFFISVQNANDKIYECYIRFSFKTMTVSLSPKLMNIPEPIMHLQFSTLYY